MTRSEKIITALISYFLYKVFVGGFKREYNMTVSLHPRKDRPTN
jgi:hypothetical protein